MEESVLLIIFSMQDSAGLPRGIVQDLLHKAMFRRRRSVSHQ